MKQFNIRLLTLLLCVVSWSASLQMSAQDAVRHTLSVVANPTIAGTFNTDHAELQVGETIQLLAYAKSNFSFKEWQDSEGNVIARTPEFEYTMPDRDVSLTAMYEYNPANPENPVKNYWDAATGVAIVDDFKAGSLSSAVSTAIKGSKTTDLLSLTVAGQMTQNDYSVINSYANCAVFDISRVTGVTEVPSYAFDYTKVESVYLPASIEKIGYRAFYQCKQLTSLTVYAMVPPTIDSSVFSGIQEGLIVYVPAAAIAQYQDDANWQKFTILPVQDDVRNLTVSLPEGATAADFAQMWLELTNTKSGQKLHYVLTDRTSYTFANIIRNTSWNAVLRNQRGDVFGRIDGIEVKNEGVNVTFSQLSRPQNVSVAVMTPEGRDVTTQTQITWVDAEGNYLAQSNSLSGLPAGYTASYRVALPQELAMLFVTPEQTEYVVNETNNSILCQLAPIPQVTLTGQVKDLTTKTALRNANVSASQTFGGRYSKTVSTKTDANGCYSLTVSSVPTSLAVSASDYISQTIVCDTMMTGAEMVNVPDVSLKGITGAVLTLNLTYTKCPTDVEDEDTFQEWYSDYNNVGYSIYNRTKQCAISQYNVQYPQIVLLEEVSEGDELELTATSKTGAFMPVVTTATIDAEQRANAAFNIVELGKIQATFVQNSNASVVGILYDAKGKLVKSYDYTNASLTVSNLVDGSYTLVSMGGSPLFNSIYDLRQLPQTGLVRGSDYVQQSVEVKSGQVTNITIDNVPTLNESALYYTGDNTSFTVNKPSIVAGNYLTLTGNIDFKSAYKDVVSNVNLIVDLPESCSFVEGSVMVGNNTSSYILQDNRVTIPMTQYTDRVRFCIIPTLGGDYAPSALCQFDIDGESVTQPIGSANYQVKDLSINVPATTAKTTIPVSGTATGGSTVEIYDGDVLIGQTIALANGSWSATCELDEAYNLSVHNIYATIKTKAGLALMSETMDVTYDKDQVVAEKVTMQYYNPEFEGQYNIVFDLINGTVTPSSYYFFPYKSWPNWRNSGTEPKEFTFVVEFSDNDPEKLSNVIVYAWDGTNRYTRIPAHYDYKSNKWIASNYFSTNNIPTNVSVFYQENREYIVDSKHLYDLTHSNISEVQKNIAASLSEIANLFESETVIDGYVYHENIDYIISKDNLSIEELEQSISYITNNPSDKCSDAEYSEICDYLDSRKEWSIESAEILDDLCDYFFFNKSTLEQTDIDKICADGFSDDDGEIVYSVTPMREINSTELDSLGYNKLRKDDSTYIYYFLSKDRFEFIDTASKLKYSFHLVKCDVYAQSANRKRVITIDDNKLKYEGILRHLGECLNALELSYTSLDNLIRGGDAINTTKSIVSLGSGMLNAVSCLYLTTYGRVKDYCDDTLNAILEERNHAIAELNSRTSKLQKRMLLEKDKLKSIDLLDKSNERFIKITKDNIRKLNNQILEINVEISRIELSKEVARQVHEKTLSVLHEMPAVFKPGVKLDHAITSIGKLAGPFGILVELWSFGTDCSDLITEMKEWNVLNEKIRSKLPCENDKRAQLIADAIERDHNMLNTHAISVMLCEAAAILADCKSIKKPSLSLWFTSGVLNGYAEIAKAMHINEYNRRRGNFYTELSYLKCIPKGNSQNGNNDVNYPPKPPKPTTDPVKAIHDPSGFVYEGVFSNRLSGVTATCYYKEMVEDMYGDLHENIVKWNAEEYAQENPLFTDENGYYRWDVPQGLWQVKFEKEGYETTYSEWLPVPPPQLDVNIAMTQLRQPDVKSARAYEDAVEVEFDKYMIPATLTEDNIYVTANGKKVEGTILLLNEEVAYKGKTEKYASKIRFNANAPFAAKEVTLTIANRVKSYAGIQMQESFSQTFDVEQEVKSIETEANITVTYDGDYLLTVKALPAAAAEGKTLIVRSSSSMIATTDAESYVLDKKGEAQVLISGELPGTTGITFTVDGYDLSVTTMVNVKIPVATEVTATPTASIASGTTVERGTKVALSCETPNATIYYTLDGSCPCNEDTRLVYTAPIVINESVTIKAMAVASDMEDSEIAEFCYIVTHLVGIDEVTLDETIKVYPLPVRDKLNVTAGGELIKSVTLVSTNGSVVAQAAKPETIVTLDVSTLAPGIYFISVATKDKKYSRKIMKVE